MKDATLVDAYMRDVNRVPLLTRESELELARRTRAGDKDARAALISANLRFVVRVAHEWKGYGVSFADLIGEGNIGLTIAADKFDPARGYRFCSFAVWWIRAKIVAFIMAEAFPVKAITTQGRRHVFFKLRRAILRLGDGATAAALAALIISETKIANPHLLRSDVEAMLPLVLAGPAQPLDFAEPDKLSLAELLADERPLIEETLGDDQERDEFRERVDLALDCLTPRERYVVRRRLMSDEQPTLAELGKLLGVSRERTRQIEQNARRKLRMKLERAA